MNKSRLEAFSDGVIAIIITIMVLDFKVPKEDDISGLYHLLPVFLSYALSFAFLGIYWNNHHHLFQAVKKIKGMVLWANLHLLFWLSLIPFSTSYMAEKHFISLPVSIYGINLLLAGLAYFILTKMLITTHGKTSVIANAIGNDLKGNISVILYALAICISFFEPFISCIIYVCVAILWFLPDKRIEKHIDKEEIE